MSGKDSLFHLVYVLKRKNMDHFIIANISAEIKENPISTVPLPL
jgi:hypothetical protein